MKQKRILIADTHPSMLEGVRLLLKDMFEVMFMVANDQSLMDAVSSIKPDLVIADLSMPICSGSNVARLLHSLSPELRFIILSEHDEQTVIDECLAAGAKGYVLKRLAILDLIPAVEAVLMGETYVSSPVRQRLDSMDRQTTTG